MRRPEPLDPAVASELHALDAALAGAPGADPELVALSREVRAAAPVLDPGARTALDARVASGFAPPAGRPRARRPGLSPRILVPALGTLAAALIALAVVGLDGDRSGGGGDSGASGVESARPAAGEIGRASCRERV